MPNLVGLRGVSSPIGRTPRHWRRFRWSLCLLGVRREVLRQKFEPHVPSASLFVSFDDVFVRPLMNSNVNTGSSIVVSMAVSNPLEGSTAAAEYVSFCGMAFALGELYPRPYVLEEPPQLSPQVRIRSAG